MPRAAIGSQRSIRRVSDKDILALQLRYCEFHDLLTTPCYGVPIGSVGGTGINALVDVLRQCDLKHLGKP